MGFQNIRPITNFMEEEETEAVEIIYSGPANTILPTLSDNLKKYCVVFSGKWKKLQTVWSASPNCHLWADCIWAVSFRGLLQQRTTNGVALTTETYHLVVLEASSPVSRWQQSGCLLSALREGSVPDLSPWRVDGHLHGHIAFSLYVYLYPNFFLL